MTAEQTTKNIGLRGVVVADSTICNVDGENGVLIYRGYDIQPLAREATYEEVVYLLLHDRLPQASELADIKLRLAAYRGLPAGVIATMRSLPEGAAPMDVLQAVVTVLAMHESDQGQETSREISLGRALRLIARLPSLVAAWARVRTGQEVVASRPELSHAAHFLYSLHGRVPDAETARVMDAVLILHAEHGFNASTFTARQVASTRAHFYAAVAAALGSLSGPLHGGANYEVFQMLREIGSVAKVRDYVTGKLDHHERIMGMGHAVYKVTDPRANILGPMAAQLAAKAGKSELYQIAEEVLRVISEEFRRRKGRDIYANVDFFSALVNSLIGIPVDMFTPVFAVGRIAGWSAHYLEERYGSVHAKPTLYRPTAEYVGRYCGPEGCAWTPVAER